MLWQTDLLEVDVIVWLKKLKLLAFLLRGTEQQVVEHVVVPEDERETQNEQTTQTKKHAPPLESLTFNLRMML